MNKQIIQQAGAPVNRSDSQYINLTAIYAAAGFRPGQPNEEDALEVAKALCPICGSPLSYEAWRKPPTGGYRAIVFCRCGYASQKGTR